MSLDVEKAEVARIVIGHSNTFGIHTGNIINWNMLKRHKFHQSMTSSDELMDGLKFAMQSWIRSMIIDPLNIPEPQSVISISNSEFEAPIDLDQREKLKLSVKLFLCEWRPALVRQAVDKIISDLRVKRIDSVILSFPVLPPTIPESNNNNVSAVVNEFHKIKPIWKALQSMVDSGHVTHIGVSDFDQEGMAALYEWARIKPTINQISLTNCFAVSSDLIQFSQERNIDLLTHNDPPEILSARKFQSFIAESTEDIEVGNWTPNYIARYSVLVRYRGIVHSKGYVMSSERRNSSGDGEDYGFF